MDFDDMRSHDTATTDLHELKLVRRRHVIHDDGVTLVELALIANDGRTVLLRSDQMAFVACDPIEVDDPTFCLLFCFTDSRVSAAVHRRCDGRPGLSQSNRRFRSFRLPFPPLTSKRAIASILGALDDKIDLNRRMNETLEAMARAIFKDWFVDFGPTRAKMEGRAPYLAPEIWALFPDRLDNEGKPEGWDITEHWRQSRRSYDRRPSPRYTGQGGDLRIESECAFEQRERLSI